MRSGERQQGIRERRTRERVEEDDSRDRWRRRDPKKDDTQMRGGRDTKI